VKSKLRSAKKLPDLPSLCLAITEHAPLPMATVEGATHIVRYVNPAFCRLMGKPMAQLVGTALSELLPEKDACMTLLDRVFRTGKPQSHTEQEDSKPHPVFWSYTMWPVLADERLVGVMIQVTETAELHGKTVAMNEALMLGAVRQHELADAAEKLNEQLRAEIDERRQAEGALRASEERFRVLFDLGPVAILSCNREGVIQNYNRRAAELWGRELNCGDRGDRLCESLKLYRLDAKLLPLAESPIIRMLETGVGVKNEQVFIERLDGARVAVAVTFAPLKNEQGEIVGAITAFYDITERLILEDTLLAHALDLARAGRSKDEFLAMLAHELRNPLAPLRNAAEILRTTSASADAREQAHRILARQIENMSRMIDDLLDVSRITEGKIELRKQVVALEAIFTAAANLTGPGIALRRQELTITLPAEPIFLNADATRLEQVVGNLLANACKYSDTGCHIWLSAERATAPGKEQPEVIVRVRDEGIGIAPDLLPRVFDLFVQATRALDRAYGGLGIGLTLVKRLVKMHGGSVEARSKGLGHGAEFIVRLPILSGASVEPPPPPARRARETARRMLIVDDNEDSARSMATLQRLRGHETRTAFTGPDAVVAAAEFVPEVVLLDIGLPGMDGFEVARRLRAMPALAGAFLVAMTGYGSDEDKTQARAAGFDEYLVKPVDVDRLRVWLRSRP
jgi:signal transduction histidine kinase/CheY-like chemotaxis protein